MNGKGGPVRRIARELHYTRKTVRKYLNRTANAPEAPTYVRTQPAPAPQPGDSAVVRGSGGSRLGRGVAT